MNIEGYKSPIEQVVSKIRMDLDKQLESHIMTAVYDIGITVDKDELIRALQYDRGQYEQGYFAGTIECATKILEAIKKKARTGYLLSEPPKIMLEILEQDLERIIQEVTEK